MEVIIPATTTSAPPLASRVLAVEVARASRRNLCCSRDDRQVKAEGLILIGQALPLGPLRRIRQRLLSLGGSGSVAENAELSAFLLLLGPLAPVEGPIDRGVQPPPALAEAVEAPRLDESLYDLPVVEPQVDPEQKSKRDLNAPFFPAPPGSIPPRPPQPLDRGEPEPDLPLPDGEAVIALVDVGGRTSIPCSGTRGCTGRSWRGPSRW